MNNRYYFFYSRSQFTERLSLEKKYGKVFIPGKVKFNGKIREFTEKSLSNNSRYSDATLVASGPSSVIITDISSKPKKQ